jgi:hypothetical protein
MIASSDQLGRSERQPLAHDHADAACAMTWLAISNSWADAIV